MTDKVVRPRDSRGRFTSGPKAKRGHGKRSKRNAPKDPMSNRRRVTLDSNIIISAVAFDSENPKQALEKATTKDRLMYTSIIHEEVIRFIENDKREIMTEEEFKKRLKKMAPVPIYVELPSDKELQEMYFIKDKTDYKILYSAEKTESVIIVTGNKRDFLTKGVKGPRGVKIMHMNDYINEKQYEKAFRKKKN